MPSGAEQPLPDALAPPAVEIVVVDTETTTIDPATARLLDIGAVRLNARLEVVATFATLVDPCRPIPLAISRLTGICDDDLGEALPEDEALVALRSFAAEATLVAHNAEFDRAQLAAAAARNGLPALGGSWFDTLESSLLLFPELDSYSLSALTSEFEIEHHAHRALPDALATAALLRHLRARAQQLSKTERSLLRRAGWRPLRLLDQLPAAGPTLRPAAPAAAGEEAAAASKPPALDVKPGDWRRALVGDEAAPLLAQLLPEFRPRSGQVELAEAISALLESGGYALFEAGTGSGKSLAYLLPAAFAAAADGRRVVISTKTKALQRQLALHEAPIVAACLPAEWRWSVLMGRENYLCRRRLDEALADVEGRLGDPQRDLALAFLVGRARLGEVDLSSLPYAALQRFGALGDLAASVRSTRATCRGRFCGHREHCLWRAARARAERSHLICVNHALLLSGPDSLPAFTDLIVDEAHLLPAEATEALSERFSQRDLERLADELETRATRSLGRLLSGPLAAEAPAPAARALTTVERLPADLRLQSAAVATSVSLLLEAQTERDDASPYAQSVWLTAAIMESPAWEAVADSVALLHEQIASLLDACHVAAELLPEDHAEQTHIGALTDLAEAARSVVAALLRPTDDDDVTWIEGDRPLGSSTGARRSAAWTFARAPLEAGVALRERLWDCLRSATLTSATLTVAGSFDYLRRELGLGSDYAPVERVFASPFDYGRQAALVALTAPEPGAGEVDTARLLAELARLAGGRTLALFTNRRALQRANESISEAMADDGLCVLAQGIHGSAAAVASAFRGTPETVLLGVDNLWTGQDFPGDALVCLAIAALPFPRQGPLFEARRRACENAGRRWFEAFYLPEAILRFRQGCGRLIRTETDYGVIVVLDPRLSQRSYGRLFSASVPEYPLHTATPATIAHQVGTLLEGFRAAAESRSPDSRSPLGGKNRQ